MDAAILSSLVRPGIVVSSGGEAGGGGDSYVKKVPGSCKGNFPDFWSVLFFFFFCFFL